MAEENSFKEEFKRYKKKSTNLEEILNLRTPQQLRSFEERTSRSSCSPSENCQATALGLKPPSEWCVLSLECIPGLLLLPDLFECGGQHHWVKQCLMHYPCKPNICNLDAHMPRTGRGCLWSDLRLPGQKSSDLDSISPPESKKLKTRIQFPKESSMYQLRWVTLGYHYNWDTKEYTSERKSPFPADLATLSSFILQHAGFPGFKAEAAIVNYYHLDSSLSGHTDHSEKDLSQPLLSISFGQSAIFLIGGKTKQIKPTPILLNSGDVVIMSREARLAYHGVPRILPPSEGEEVPPSLSGEMISHGACGWNLASAERPQENTVSCTATSCAQCQELISDWPDIESYLAVSRINVNVRQVISEKFKF